jgi:hypothetical protein
MSSLEEMLAREIKKRGNDSFVAQQLRNQIAAEKRCQSTQHMYLSGVSINHSSKADAKHMNN